MKWDFCAYEAELKRAVREGRWPEACEPALRAHVGTCQHCADVALVSQTLQRAWLEGSELAPLPPAGVLWWRAQLRRRNGAIQRAVTPIALAEKVALAVTLLAAIALIPWQWTSTADWFGWLTDVIRSDAFRLTTLFSPGASGNGIEVVLITAIGALGLVGGVAVYLATERE